MKLLITGALGHIGSQFIHNIRPGEYTEVVLLDNLSTQRYCSLFNLPQGVPFRFVEGDILTADLEQLFAGIDVVIHLAAITNAAGSFEIQEQVEQVNFEGTKRVAQACMTNHNKMIYLSTTSVYGTQGEVVDEDCSIEDLKPQSPYAESKLHSEQLLQSLGQRNGLRFIICRFGTIFGTSIGMRFHTAVNKFCWQASLGLPITVWQTALDQKRPYLDLGDAIRALNFILATDRFDNQIYNVLTINTTVREIVDTIRAEIPDTQIQYVDTAIMNQLSYNVSVAKFQALGFQFGGNLQKGIQDTLHLIRNARSVS
jgi:nucleoside-diphosphate-sugar epimerase